MKALYKRIIEKGVVGLAVLLLFAVPVRAATDTRDASVTVTVSSIFSLTLDISTIDFGSMAPGDTKELYAGDASFNEAICRTSNNNAWNLQIRYLDQMRSGSNTIPEGNFKWMSTYAGSKNEPYPAATGTLNHPPESGYINYTTSDELVYSSGVGEGNTLPNGIGIQFKYFLSIPGDQVTGDYTTTVRYTMTE